jgi:hypothetical protein
MITTLTITLVSGFILLVLSLKKNWELKAGRDIFSIATNRMDQRVESLLYKTANLVKMTHPERIKEIGSKIAIKVEGFVMGIVEKLSSRFSIVGDMVTGRDIPKNRGSVSFFLKNIENSKKQVK